MTRKRGRKEQEGNVREARREKMTRNAGEMKRKPEGSEAMRRTRGRNGRGGNVKEGGRDKRKTRKIREIKDEGTKEKGKVDSGDEGVREERENVRT